MTITLSTNNQKRGLYYFKLPSKIIMDAALKDLTGKEYIVRSETHPPVYPKVINRGVESLMDLME